MPLTETSSTDSLDQLASSENILVAREGLYNSLYQTNKSNKASESEDRSLYNANNSCSIHRVQNDARSRTNTFSKFANYQTRRDYSAGRYKAYSRKSLSSKPSQSSLLYSENSTLHSTSTRRFKSELSSSTNKNSTGSSQLTTSAYLSSSSESRPAKSISSYATQPPKSLPNLTSMDHCPSLPHLPITNSLAMQQNTSAHPSLTHYATPKQKPSRPVSEKYYPTDYSRNFYSRGPIHPSIQVLHPTHYIYQTPPMMYPHPPLYYSQRPYQHQAFPNYYPLVSFTSNLHFIIIKLTQIPNNE